MGGKSAPAAPDYTPIAQADEQQANQDYQLQEQELNWSKQQYANEEPYVNQLLQQDISNSGSQSAIAGQQQQFYDSTYQPIEKEFATEAQNYGNADNQNQQAGAAEASVASSYDAARASAQSSLESYGIDPSQTRFGALDLGTQVSQAAATAAAGTQSRLNTQMTGLQLESQAINTGRGYANSVAQSFGGAASSGASGVSSYNNAYGTGAGANTGSTAFGNQGVNAFSGAGNALNQGFSNALDSDKLGYQEGNTLFQNISGLAGGALGF
jgi:hypothetical protein